MCRIGTRRYVSSSDLVLEICFALLCLACLNDVMYANELIVDLPPPILARRHCGQRQVESHTHDATLVAARGALAREQEQFAVRKQSPRDAYRSGEEAVIDQR